MQLSRFAKARFFCVYLCANSCYILEQKEGLDTWYFIFIDENASHSSRALLMSGGKSGSGFTGEEMIQDQGKIYETLPNLLKPSAFYTFARKYVQCQYRLVKLSATSSRNALVHDFSLLHHRTTTTPADFYRKFSLMASGKKVFNGCDASSKSILPQKK